MRPFVFIIACLLLAQSASAGVYLTITRPSNPGPSPRESAATEVRKQIRAAETELSRAYAQAMQEHPLAVQLKQARVQLMQASIAHEQLRSHLIRTKNDSLEFRQLNMQIRIGGQELYNEKDEHKRFEKARALLELRAQRSRLISEAIAGDIDLAVAQAEMLDATNKVRSLEQEYQNAIRDDARFAAAKQRLDAARQQLAGL